MLTHHEDPAARRWRYGIAAGKRAESWQQADLITQLKTRQTQALPALALQGINRVHVVGECRLAGAWGLLMAQGERPEREGLVHHLDSEVGRRVVVVADQGPPQCLMTLGKVELA